MLQLDTPAEVDISTDGTKMDTKFKLEITPFYCDLIFKT